MMLVPRPHTTKHAEDEAVIEKKHDHALRRVFDPIPRPVMYAAGIVLGLAIFSPFWAYLVFERFEKKPVFLTDDAPLPPGSTNAVPVTAVPVLGTNRTAAADLTEYAGIRLESRREDLDHRFSLTLQNMRGMQPEIYMAQPASEIDQITAHFYDGILKEFTLIMRERLVAPAQAEAQLIEQFGRPMDQTAGADSSPPGLGGLGLGDDALAKKLAAFPRRRRWVWVDSQSRVDAMLCYANGETAPTLAVLQIRVAAAAWLKTFRPMVGATAAIPVPTNRPAQLINPLVPLERKLAP
jgi:hypothetical protein